MHSLAANFSAPIAVIARRAEPLRRSGRSAMLNSAASIRREKLYLINPYDPDCIPLLMVHGLHSSPVSFANLSNGIVADPQIRESYQVWHYHYPTRTPVLLNAAIFRHVLKRTLWEIDPEGDDFARNHILVLGDSRAAFYRARSPVIPATGYGRASSRCGRRRCQRLAGRRSR
jgi:hypothetical protein